LITLIVGKPNNTRRCKIISMSEAIGTEKISEFDCSNRDTLKPGDPKWSNYVKGCIANFTRNIYLVCKYEKYLLLKILSGITKLYPVFNVLNH
jgi:hypothetical protein